MTKKYPHRLIDYHGKTHVVLGWREWVALPELGIPRIKAKIDTGARTSALHAFDIERFRHAGKDKVRFDIHPIQRNDNIVIKCVADLVDIRLIRDSGAHREFRHVIETSLILGDKAHTIEITLTNRSLMTFRMLLGRKALHDNYLIDPRRSYRT